MKIAFISYEYPPDTAFGGVATYVHQAATMLHRRGHEVEVFSNSPRREGTFVEDGVTVHLTRGAKPPQFAAAIGEVFARRHRAVAFDVLEAPEYFAEAREAVKLAPDIPLVVKLHTSSILLLELNYYEPRFARKVVSALRSLRRRERIRWGYDPRFRSHHAAALQQDRIERAHALQADEIVAPSRDIASRMIREWRLDPALMSHVPYPFVPSPRLLAIPADTQTNVVSFIGRLEMRKGVIDLARAIPAVLRRFPDVKFRLVGGAEPSPIPKVDMRRYLERMLAPHLGSVEFCGAVSFDRIPDVLAATDICVFPSVWENFPCVCLEAMAAARGIVGGAAGGMADMLDGGNTGRLVPPRTPRALAGAIMELLADRPLRVRLGTASRERLLRTYNLDVIGALQEESYRRAIARRQARGTRELREDAVSPSPQASR